jgi:hypothetical protein
MVVEMRSRVLFFCAVVPKPKRWEANEKTLLSKELFFIVSVFILAESGK